MDDMPAWALTKSRLCAPHCRIAAINKLRIQTRNQLQAVRAIMRKLLHAIHTMLKNRTPSDSRRFHTPAGIGRLPIKSICKSQDRKQLFVDHHLNCGLLGNRASTD